MGKIFITSDWHFGHDRDFVWGARGFKDVNEMNEAIVNRHNEIVGADDDVYFLGDAVFGDVETSIEFIKKLNGKIHMINGNHDTKRKIELYKSCDNIVECGDFATVIKYHKYNFYLSHYPTITSNLDGDKPLNRRMINLCGHLHTEDKFVDMNLGLCYHCEVDAHNCYPVDLDTIIEDISEYIKGDNKNENN